MSTDIINFQINKANKPSTDSKIVVSKKYHNFFDVFSKKALDIVTKYSKYNHKIRLLEEHKSFSYSLLRGMSQKQLEFVKKSSKIM